MSRYTIHNSNNVLDSITSAESKCIFNFASNFEVYANIPKINSKDGITTITFKYGSSYRDIQTSNGIATKDSNTYKPTIY